MVRSRVLSCAEPWCGKQSSKAHEPLTYWSHFTTSYVSFSICGRKGKQPCYSEWNSCSVKAIFLSRHNIHDLWVWISLAFMCPPYIVSVSFGYLNWLLYITIFCFSVCYSELHNEDCVFDVQVCNSIKGSTSCSNYLFGCWFHIHVSSTAFNGLQLNDPKVPSS